ncbi:hypothetical protein CYMTET_39033 [Cymbomonas tetramitiformis]|uniref:Uncharacterized protein n=1 Tax=Cymbomonas tetramitiformis TaxID=36881 RepID=A0AAE0F4B8_9CHLO|nr:hypothetical protein CYMTET_39033 [Cymbomonas tetramitiformis]|eukprot:gene886-1383_t
MEPEILAFGIGDGLVHEPPPPAEDNPGYSTFAPTHPDDLTGSAAAKHTLLVEFASSSTRASARQDGNTSSSQVSGGALAELSTQEKSVLQDLAVAAFHENDRKSPLVVTNIGYRPMVLIKVQLQSVPVEDWDQDISIVLHAVLSEIAFLCSLPVESVLALSSAMSKGATSATPATSSAPVRGLLQDATVSPGSVEDGFDFEIDVGIACANDHEAIVVASHLREQMEFTAHGFPFIRHRVCYQLVGDEHRLLCKHAQIVEGPSVMDMLELVVASPDDVLPEEGELQHAHTLLTTSEKISNFLTARDIHIVRVYETRNAQTIVERSKADTTVYAFGSLRTAITGTLSGNPPPARNGASDVRPHPVAVPLLMAVVWMPIYMRV